MAVELKPSPTRECAICHFRWLEPFYYEERGTPLHPLQVDKVAGTEMMCFSCHDGSTEDSRVKVWLRDRHKVNVRPSSKVHVPKIFPLSQDGKIVCSTCHSAHGVPTDTSIERVIFLRISNTDSIMCEMCHVEQTRKGHNHPLKTTMKLPIPQALLEGGAMLSTTDPKKVICESCHTAHGGVEKNFVLKVSDSSLCSSCHRDKDVETEPNLSARRNHPLSVRFSEVSSAPRLFAGPNRSVQCSSCHKVHQPGAEKPPYKLLCAPAEDSTLCLYCHEKRATKGKNHPTGVLLKDLRVKFEGASLFTGPGHTLQCLTCHGTHLKRPNAKALVAVRDRLCEGCHRSKALVIGTDHDLRITAPGEKNVLGEGIKEGGTCSPCHVAHDATGPYLWARKHISGPQVPSDLCLECHKEGGMAQKKLIGSMSHPVGVAMRSPPARLPLFVTPKGRGQLECGTCHDPHRWSPGALKAGPGKNEEGGPLSSFLRMPIMPRPRLCAECHPDQVAVATSDHNMAITAPLQKNIHGQDVQGWGVCSPCHIVHNASGPYLWARRLDKGLSHPSDLCQNCHMKGGLASKKAIEQNSHPVRLTMKDRPRGLPLFKVGDRENNLECGTCHDPHKWQPGARSSDGSGHQNREGTEKNSFLRKANLPSPSLCDTCHPQQGCVSGTDHDLRITAPDYVNLKGEAVGNGSPCRACHGVHNAREKALLWVAPLGKGQDFIEMSCYGCHSKGGPAAVKTVAAGTHPKKLYFGYYKRYLQLVSLKGVPLFTNDGRRSLRGEITCATCHDPHIWDDEHPASTPNRNEEGTLENSFLYKRLDLAQEYCSICHGPSALFLFRFYHDKSMRKDLHEHDGVPLIQILR